VTLENIMTAHAALSFGVLLCTLAFSLGVLKLDYGAPACVSFSVGFAIAWPIAFVAFALVLALVLCVSVVYVPAGLIAAVRGKPFIVTRESK
jgi:hypothetical protein